MTERQAFPEPRSDGSATVVAVFREPLTSVTDEVRFAFADWRESLSQVDIAKDLAAEPVARASEEGFRVVFEIRPGSRLWRDWTVGLVSALQGRLGKGAFAGFYDAVSGRMHPAVLGDSGQDDGD